MAASLLLTAFASGAQECDSLPDAPDGFTAETISSTSVFLSWKEVTPPPSCQVSYTVYRDTGAGSRSVTVFSGQATSVMDSGLAPATTYSYFLAAETAAGTSLYWPGKQATTLPEATVCSELPAAPSGLSATALSTSEIGLAWSAVTPPLACSVTYTIYRGTRSDFVPSYDNEVASGWTATSFTESGLSPSTTYFYKLAATDEVGSTESTIVASATTPSEAPVCAAVPPAPAGIQATASSPSQINVSWSAVTPPSGCAVTYAIHRSTTANFTPAAANQVIAGLSGTSYSDTGLTPSTTYHYVVRAIDSVGSSDRPAPVSATTPAVTTCTAAPSAPGGLAATAASSSQIDLRWSAVTPPAGCSLTYALFRDTKSGFTPGWGTLLAPGITGTSYSDSGLAPAATYYYVVQAVDSAGISANSGEANATTQRAPIVCDAAPPAASGLVATALSPTRIDVSWNRVEPPPGCSVTYSVFRSMDASFGSPVMLASGLVTTSYSNTGLAPSTTYYYGVRTSDSKGDSLSTPTSATTAGTVTCTAAPSAPAGVTATGRSPRQIDLSWSSVTPPAGCTGVTYTVYQSTTAGFTPADANRVATNLASPSYSSTGLTAATTYHFVVRAADGAGTSAGSSEVSAATAPDVTCTAVPSAPLAVAATATSASQIDLRWGSVTPPAGCSALTYAVHQSTDAGFTPSDANRVATNLPAPSYSSTGLAPSTTYHFVVRAIDAAGASPASEKASAATRSDAPACAAVPSAPTGLVAVARSANVIDLSWSPVSPRAGCSVAYAVHQGTAADFVPSDANRVATNLPSSAFTATGLSPSTTYHFVVRAVDAAGSSPDSARGTATTPSGKTDLSAGGCSSFGAPADAAWTLLVLASLAVRARSRRGPPAGPGR